MLSVIQVRSGDTASKFSHIFDFGIYYFVTVNCFQVRG